MKKMDFNNIQFRFYVLVIYLWWKNEFKITRKCKMKFYPK
jgi:hypothetical protein